MHRHRIFDSIVTRLLLLGLCIVLAGAAVLYYAMSRFLREDMGVVVASQQLSLANYIASDIDEKIVERLHLLEQLSAALPADLLYRPQALQDWLQQRYEYQPLFKGGIFVADPQGVALADFPVVANRRGSHYADRDYIRAAMAGQSYVGKAVIGRAIKEPILPMAVPKRNAQGEVLAVLAGITPLADPGFLDPLLRGQIGGAGGGFLLVSPRDQIFVASSRPEMVLKPTPPPGVNLLHDQAMAGLRGTGTTVNVQGVEEISAMVSVPSTGWFVVARLPTREAFAPIERAQRFLLQVFLLILLAYVVFAAVGLYLLFRPVFSAAAQAQGMSQGEQALVPLPVVRQDEIGYLVSAFNRLLARLNDKQAELARMAHYDALTGLPNRALLYDRLQQVLAQARRRNARVAVLFMDLDAFKHVNDTLGHEAGDEALRQTAARFSAIAREADTLARVGGDEFVLVLADLEQDAETAAVAVATKFIHALQLPLEIAGVPCTLGVSIGIALSQGEHTPDALMLAADQAMYQAKAAGRNQYVIARLDRSPAQPVSQAN